MLSESQARETWVVIPAYQEAAIVRRTADAVRALGVHVVVVDDGSTDGTCDALVGADVTVLRHAVNLGQGAALQTGLDWALARGAKWLVTFDADGQHEPGDVPRLVRALIDGGVDVVLGSRFMGSAPGLPRSRRALVAAARVYTRWATGLKLTDVHNGLRAFRAEVAPKVRLTMRGMAHASELLSLVARHRLRWIELPVVVHYTPYSRAKGQSALGAVDVLFELTLQRLFP